MLLINCKKEGEIKMKQEQNLKSLKEMKDLLGISNPEIQSWEDLKKEIERNQKPNLAMLTDFYEFTMSQAFFDAGDSGKKVYFDIFFRTNPFDGGYTIHGGLGEIIDFIKDFHYTEADIEFLRKSGEFSEEFLAYLKDLRFHGDMWAIKEGTPIFPNEPVITIHANIIEAQLLESLMLAYFNHGSLIATSAKRITTAACEIPTSDFGLRRGHGEGTINGSKYAMIGGCASTSNTLSGQLHDMKVSGTMAHALVQFYGNDYDAFMVYAKANPNNCVFLVDTFDTLKKGIPAAIKVAKEFLIPNGYPFIGIRIDSGDLAYFSKEARKMLDEAGFEDAKIFLTNGLSEDKIISLRQEGACIDAIGAGDNVLAPKERMNGVYKLVAVEELGTVVPRIKISGDEVKTTNPSYKKVYRFYDKNTGYALGDVIALADEVIPKDQYTLVSPTEEWKTTKLKDYVVKELQVPIFEQGKLVYDVPTAMETAAYAKDQFETLYPEIKRSIKPHGYYVDLSKKLLQLKKELLLQYANSEEEKVKTIGEYHA